MIEGDNGWRLSYGTLLMTLIKAIVIIGVAAVLVYSCIYAYRSGLNIGLALCIFTASAIVFIILLYWVAY